MMSSHFLPYSKQSIDENDIRAVEKSLRNPIITRGPLVANFEELIANYCNSKYAVAFSNATAALQAAFWAAEISSFDRIVTTPNTFISTVSAALPSKATLVFLDIDCTNGNLSMDAVKNNINKEISRGRSFFVPVHFAGIAFDSFHANRFINDPNTVIIEDAAHALGSYYSNGTKVGSCGTKVGSCECADMTIFSFHPAKNMTTGEGGIITSNKEDLISRLKCFRDNGIVRDPSLFTCNESDNTHYLGYYESTAATGNFHMTEMQAALGISQLKRLDAFVEKRRALVKAYRELLKEIPEIVLFDEKYDAQTAYHLLVAQIPFDKFSTTREKTVAALKERGIGTQVHYIPLYNHPVIKNICGDINEYFPQMEAYFSQALSLPLYYDLTFENVSYVVRSLKQVLNV